MREEQTRNVVMKKLIDDGVFKFNSYIRNESTLTPTVLFKKFASYYGLPPYEANKVTTGDKDAEEPKLAEKKYSGWLEGTIKNLGFQWEGSWDVMEPIMVYVYKWAKIPHASSVAASGVIMTDYIPDLPVRDGSIAYDSHDLEENGFIKYDLLSIDTLNEIQPFYGDTIDWEDTNDPEVWKVYQSGDTDFAFQFSSGGMKGLLKDNQTSNVLSLAEINALFRPGPIGLGMLDTYTKNTQGNVKFSPEDAVLYLLLKREFGDEHSGMTIFQEDVMKIVSAGAGFDMVESDDIRRAMGKKKFALLESYQPKFDEGWKYPEYYDFGKLGKYLGDDELQMSDGTTITAEVAYDRLMNGEELDILPPEHQYHMQLKA